MGENARFKKRTRVSKRVFSGVRGVRWDKVYGTNLDQVGPTWTNLAKLVVVLLCFAFLEKHLGPPWTKLVQYSFPQYSCTPEFFSAACLQNEIAPEKL